MLLGTSNHPPLHTRASFLAQNTFYCLLDTVTDLVAGGLTAYELNMFNKAESEVFLCEIGAIAEFRKQGIAAKLIETLKAICLKQSIKVIFVCTLPGNETAKSLNQSTIGEFEVAPFYTYNLA